MKKIAALLILTAVFCFNNSWAQPFSFTIQSSLYPNGYHVSQHGASDGTITLTFSNGEAPFALYGRMDQNSAYQLFEPAIDTTVFSANTISAATYWLMAIDNTGDTAYANITITQPAAIQPLLIFYEKSQYAGGYNISTFGGNNGTITVNVTGGLSPYHFLWNDGITQKDRVNLSAGTYTVLVTDSLGDSATAAITMLQPGQALGVEIMGPASPCGMPATNMLNAMVSGGTPPYQYQWLMEPAIILPPTTSMFPVPAAGGLFHVKVWDANQDSTTASYTAQPMPPPLYVTVTPVYYPNAQVFSCDSCNDGRMYAAVIGGIPPYTYTWNSGMFPNSNNDTLFNIPYTVTSFTVTVVDSNGCMVSGNYMLNAPPPPPPPMPLVVTGYASVFAATGNVSCDTCSDGSINLTVTGGMMPYSYNWSNGATTQNISGIDTGYYSVTVTDMMGATVTQGFNILYNTPPPAATIFLSFMNLDTTAKTVEVWVNNTGGAIGDFGFDLTSAIPGSLQEAYGGLAATNGYSVSVGGAAMPSVNGNRNGGTLPSGTYHLTTLRFYGSLPYTSICFMGAGGFRDTLNMPVAVSTGMCISTGLMPPPPLPPATLIVMGYPYTYPATGNVSCPACADGSISLMVSGGLPPYSYNWSNGATTQNIAAIDTGYYSVTVTDMNGDSAHQGFNIMYYAPPPPPPPATIFLSFMNVDTAAKTVEVWVNNMGTAIGDFGFSLMSGVLQEAFGGIAATNGYTVNAGGASPAMSMLVTANRNGGYISTGNHHLTTLRFSGALPDYNVCFMGASGFKDTLNMPLAVSMGMCIATGVTPPPPPPVPLMVMGYPYTYPATGNVSCQACSDGSINLMVSGGMMPYSYSWSNGATTQNISGIDTGYYSVTVTDMMGASYTQGFNITFISMPPPPTGLMVMGYPAMFPGTGNVSCPACADGSISLMVNGGMPPYTYNWSNGATTQNISGIDTGYYSVTVTDMMGATQSQGFTIFYTGAAETVMALSVAKSTFPGGYNVSCVSCADGWASITVTGGMPPYTFYMNNTPLPAWINGQTFNNLNPGTAYIKITDMAGDSVTTDVVMLAPMNQVSVQLSATVQGGCNGGSVTGNVSAMVNGGTPPYNYQWSGPMGPLPDNFASAYITQPGTYYITVTDANNSTAQANVNVVAPPSLNVWLDAPQQHGTAHTGCTVHDGKIYIHLNGGQPPYNVNVTGNLSGQNNNDNSGNNGPMPGNGFSRYFYTTDTLLVLDSLAAGNYWVNVNDMSNCQSGSNVEIRQTEPPRISVGGTEYENGYYFSCDTCHDAQMSAVVTGGFGNLQYHWFEIPQEYASMALKGASLFMSENKDFNMNELPPAVSTSQTATIANAETLHGLVVADELGCVGFTNFTLEKPKPANGWGFAGNNGAGKWLGTRDSTDLVLKSNGEERFILKADGKINIPDFSFTPDSNGEFKILGLDENGNIKSLFWGSTGPRPDPPPCGLPQNPWVLAPGSTNNIALCGFENVGIGYFNPQHKLGVLGTGYFSGNVGIGETNAEAKLHVKHLSGNIGETALKISAGNNTIAIDVSQPGNAPNFRVFGTGDVYARDIKVRSSDFPPTPDYVFEKDYQLMPLPDLEQYLITHKHLPEIPSAKDVEQDGYSLGNMNILLLKKVEELTLYIIQQQKAFAEQQKEIEQLKKQGNK